VDIKQIFYEELESIFDDFLKDEEEFLKWISSDGLETLIDKKVESIFTAQHMRYENISNPKLAKTIDHTLLKAEATVSEIVSLCNEAKQFEFASVCINPCYVDLCSKELNASDVKVCTVIGFPLGANTSHVKKNEAEHAINQGAGEVDMVINIGMLKQKEYNFVIDDITGVISKAKGKSILSKVIIETALLTNEEKIKACMIAKKAGADFVKTSTGFSKGGATIHDVALMKFIVGDEMFVKASGGIRTRQDAISMLMNGADRIGTSSGIKIINPDL